MTPSTNSKMTIRGAKLLLRVLWFAFALYYCIMAWFCIPSLIDTPPDAFDALQPYRSTLIGINFGLLLLIPISCWVRNQAYKAGWHGNAISPDGYVNGMSKVLGTLALPAGVSTLAVFFLPEFKLNLIPLLVVLIVHMANFPTGKPMEPIEVRLGT